MKRRYESSTRPVFCRCLGHHASADGCQSSIRVSFHETRSWRRRWCETRGARS